MTASEHEFGSAFVGRRVGPSDEEGLRSFGGGVCLHTFLEEGSAVGSEQDASAFHINDVYLFAWV